MTISEEQSAQEFLYNNEATDLPEHLYLHSYSLILVCPRIPHIVNKKKELGVSYLDINFKFTKKV